MKLVIGNKTILLQIASDYRGFDNKTYIEYLVTIEDLETKDSRQIIVICRDLFHAISTRNAIAEDLKAGNYWTFSYSSFKFLEINKGVNND
jgi:hypothetical protein